MEDQRSTNGLKINQVKVEQNKPIKLKSGDKLSFAEYDFKFLLVEQFG